MGWKKDRLEQGWKQQLVWLRPETVAKLKGMKEHSGKSYQDIINEIILNYDRPLEDEETKMERRLLERLEASIEAKLERKRPEPGERMSNEEESGIEIPDDLQDSDKRQILNTIRELHENEGRSFRSIVDYLRQKGIKATKKGT